MHIRSMWRDHVKNMLRLRTRLEAVRTVPARLGLLAERPGLVRTWLAAHGPVGIGRPVHQVSYTRCTTPRVSAAQESHAPHPFLNYRLKEGCIWICLSISSIDPGSSSTYILHAARRTRVDHTRARIRPYPVLSRQDPSIVLLDAHAPLPRARIRAGPPALSSLVPDLFRTDETPALSLLLLLISLESWTDVLFL